MTTAMALKKKELRVYIPLKTDRLLRAVLPLRNGDRNWTLSDAATEAIDSWLKQPENQTIIDRYGLNKE